MNAPETSAGDGPADPRRSPGICVWEPEPRPPNATGNAGFVLLTFTHEHPAESPSRPARLTLRSRVWVSKVRQPANRRKYPKTTQIRHSRIQPNGWNPPKPSLAQPDGWGSAEIVISWDGGQGWRSSCVHFPIKIPRKPWVGQALCSKLCTCDAYLYLRPYRPIR